MVLYFFEKPIFTFQICTEVFCQIACPMKFFLSAVFFLIASIQGLAQPGIFNTLDVEDGLSQNSVLSITQDAKGYLWFGTRHGLNKYDARTFKVFKTEKGDSTISANYIVSLYTDQLHTLWAGTANGGLNRYNPELNIFEHISLKTATVTEDSNICVNVIYQDSKGRLWVGTANALNLLTGRKEGTFTSFTTASHPGLAGNNIHSICEDHEGNVWIGTSSGLSRLTNEKGFHFEAYRHSDHAGSISENYVTSIIEDKFYNLWIGTLTRGLNMYNPRNGTFVNYLHEKQNSNSISNNNIRKLLVDKAGNLWIGTQEGLTIIDAGGNTITPFVHEPGNKKSLSQNSVHSLFEDKDGTIWIGTYFGGVNSCYRQNMPFSRYANFASNIISSIVEDSVQNLWVGTEGGGLNYFNRKTGTITNYQYKPEDSRSLSSNLIKVLYKDKEGNIWIGTHRGGLNLFNPGDGSFSRLIYQGNDPGVKGYQIYALLEDSKGRFWVGEEPGLRFFYRHGRVLEAAPNPAFLEVLKSLSVTCLLEDRNKETIWIGTNKGLYRLKGNGLEKVKGSSEASVNCMMQDSKGEVWIGQGYEGLLNYNPATRQFKNYNSSNAGLNNNKVLGILEDGNGNLWLSTENGLCKFAPGGNNTLTYNTSDGLAGNVFNNNSFYKNSKGEMFFGGYKGITSFFPTEIKDGNLQPDVVITGLRLFNQPVAIKGSDNILPKDISLLDQIELKYSQNVFTIDFSVLNFIKPGKNKFAYQLKGIDNNWNYVSTPSVSYNNLPPGNYTFWVKGANNDGIWSQPVSLHIKILPPLWRTWWAYAIYISLLFILIFLITRYFFLRELYKRNNELTQLKLNFFTNISHEIRTHLSLIIGPAEKLMLSGKGYDSYDMQQFQSIKKNSESLLQLVDELMDFRKAETGNLKLHVSNWDIVPFIQSVYLSFIDISVSKNIHTELNLSPHPVEIWFDKEQMEKVVFNLLSNAFKFTPEGGRITIAVEEKLEKMVIQVLDNGSGISEENMEKLFDNYFQGDDHGRQHSGYGIGLALSKSIVEMHHGELSVDRIKDATYEEEVTCFSVELRKGNAHFKAGEISPYPGEIKNNISAPLNFSGNEASVEFAAEKEAVSTNNRYTLLVVEDNDAIRKFIRDSFSDQYSIIESKNGNEGLQQAFEIIPDLIISDVMMPEMDGLAMCNTLKTDVRTSHIPVILLTAKTAVPNQIKGLQTGADMYLTKPFSIQVLELQVRNLLASIEKIRQRFRIVLDAPDTDSKPVSLELNPIDRAFLNTIEKIVDEYMDDPAFGAELVAKKVAMSKSVLYKKIKAITGVSVNDYTKSLRLQKAAKLLQEKHTVNEVAFMVGYSDRKHFGTEFKKYFGKLPSDYKNL
jgi:ligand-binding sensor domain-containing protein/signal transduction histidine kinase/CheY-like chemotaxis protein